MDAAKVPAASSNAPHNNRQQQQHQQELHGWRDEKRSEYFPPQRVVAAAFTSSAPCKIEKHAGGCTSPQQKRIAENAKAWREHVHLFGSRKRNAGRVPSFCRSRAATVWRAHHPNKNGLRKTRPSMSAELLRLLMPRRVGECACLGPVQKDAQNLERNVGERPAEWVTHKIKEHRRTFGSRTAARAPPRKDSGQTFVPQPKRHATRRAGRPHS